MVIFNSYVSLPEGIFTTSIRKNPVARGSGIRGSSPHLTVPSDRCGGLGLHRLRCNLESVTMNESCLEKCPILSILYHFISFYPSFKLNIFELFENIILNNHYQVMCPCFCGRPSPLPGILAETDLVPDTASATSTGLGNLPIQKGLAQLEKHHLWL
jgi:hypothetical protein